MWVHSVYRAVPHLKICLVSENENFILASVEEKSNILLRSYTAAEEDASAWSLLVRITSSVEDDSSEIVAGFGFAGFFPLPFSFPFFPSAFTNRNTQHSKITASENSLDQRIHFMIPFNSPISGTEHRSVFCCVNKSLTITWNCVAFGINTLLLLREQMNKVAISTCLNKMMSKPEYSCCWLDEFHINCKRISQWLFFSKARNSLNFLKPYFKMSIFYICTYQNSLLILPKVPGRVSLFYTVGGVMKLFW